LIVAAFAVRPLMSQLGCGMTPFGPSQVCSRNARAANVLDRANSDFPMLFTRLASLRDDHDGPEVTYAMILLRRNSPASRLCDG